MCGAQGWASQKADSHCPSNTVHTYFQKSSVVFLSSLVILPCLVLFFGFFSLWVYIKTLQCSYYYSSVNWTKGLHGLCWFDIDFETYKLSPGIGALLNTCSYSLVNCMRGLHFALCTLHQCWFGIDSCAYQLGPSIGYCIKLGISHTFSSNRNIDMHALGSYQVLDFFCILVSKMRS